MSNLCISQQHQMITIDQNLRSKSRLNLRCYEKENLDNTTKVLKEHWVSSGWRRWRARSGSCGQHLLLPFSWSRCLMFFFFFFFFPRGFYGRKMVWSKISQVLAFSFGSFSGLGIDSFPRNRTQTPLFAVAVCVWYKL